MGSQWQQRLIHIQVTLTPLRVIPLLFQLHSNADLTVKWWNPEDALLNNAVRRQMDRLRSVDGHKRHTDPQL
jgi:hypothetical protein